MYRISVICYSNILDEMKIRNAKRITENRFAMQMLRREWEQIVCFFSHASIGIDGVYFITTITRA